MALDTTPLTPDQITKLKAQYGKLYKVAYDADTSYIVRAIKRPEYKDLLALLQTIPDPTTRGEMHDEKVCQLGVVWPSLPTDWADNSPAGLILTLSTQIMDRSGFTQSIEVTEI
jgi:hypothetical protein